MRSICRRRVSQLGLGGCQLRLGLKISPRRPSIQSPLKQLNKPAAHSFSTNIPLYARPQAQSPEKAFQKRVEDINNAYPEPYPRHGISEHSLTCKEFHSQYGYLEPEKHADDTIVVYGRIRSRRTISKSLMFFDLIQEGCKLQVLCSSERLASGSTVTGEESLDFKRLLRRGDILSVTGKPYRTRPGELSIEAIEPPKLLSPCLHNVPVDEPNHDTAFDRHVQFLAFDKHKQVIQCRSHIIQYIRQFLLDESFLEVDTPILSSDAGGAIAKPFRTSATEFPERQVSLRIAPELWLKRMVVGGFDKVFEIGPSFRNEGIDKTHNPEFTMCEFYHAYADLEKLLSMTENLLTGLAESIRKNYPMIGDEIGAIDFEVPFVSIDFIPGIEKAIGRRLPDLQASSATSELLQIYRDLSLPVPAVQTLPRLLDKLCSEYLEPHCQNPTFIINPPECLSPLSKVFTHPGTNQRVAARGELFIKGKEIANMYEEENSPVEQRRKFQEQLTYREEGEPGNIDERYLQALEWGLPPTGGWGCGIDRLCMLFTGTERIEGVLSFGNLRTVTGQQASREEPAE